MDTDTVVSSLEFISRLGGYLVANATITAQGEYADKAFPSWRVLPHGRNCAPITYLCVKDARWYQRRGVAVCGNANGEKMSARLTRGEIKLVRELVAEADMAAQMVMENKWSVIDL